MLFNSSFQISKFGNRSSIFHSTGAVCLSVTECYLFGHLCQCNLQYVGSTSTEFKVRFRNHKSNMLKNKRTCELAIHFNDSEHEISQISFNKLGLLKSLYILNDYYSLDKPIGPCNYSPLILMVSTNGENLDQNTALITTIE